LRESGFCFRPLLSLPHVRVGGCMLVVNREREGERFVRVGEVG